MKSTSDLTVGKLDLVRRDELQSSSFEAGWALIVSFFGSSIGLKSGCSFQISAL